MYKSCIKTLYADFSHIVANLTVSRINSAVRERIWNQAEQNDA